MKYTVKPVMENKFWIVEDADGLRKGTVSVGTDKVTAVVNGLCVTFETLNDCADHFKLNFNNNAEPDMDTESTYDVEGYPTHTKPYNSFWDIKKKIPLFTRTEKSKSLHAAGYYAVRFDTQWAASFCPRMTTLDKNQWIGPFKDKFEVRERIRVAINEN